MRKLLAVITLIFLASPCHAQWFKVINEAQHPLQHRASRVRTDTSAFSGGLTGTEVNVQIALEALAVLTGDGTFLKLDASNDPLTGSLEITDGSDITTIDGDRISTDATWLELGNNASGILQFGGSGSETVLHPLNNHLTLNTTRAADDIIFEGNDVQQMKIDAGNNNIIVGVPASLVAMGLVDYYTTSDALELTTMYHRGDDAHGFALTRAANNNLFLHIGRQYSIDSSTFKPHMTFDKDGKVGVGKIDPGVEVDVVGDIAATGKITMDDGVAAKPATTYTVCASSAIAKDACDYTCDGTADDVQIQAAIDALPGNGGKIFLSEGQFEIAATLSIVQDGVWIDGSGTGTTILSLANGVDADMIAVTAASTLNYFTATNLRAQGNSGNNSAGSFFFDKAGADFIQEVRFENLYVTDFVDDAIDLDDSNNLIIMKCSIIGNLDDGVTITDGGGIRITNSRITNTGHGINIDGGNVEEGVISNNLLGGGAGKAGLYLAGTKMDIVGNVFRDAGGASNRGIWVTGGSNLIVSNFFRYVSGMDPLMQIDAGATSNYIMTNQLISTETLITDNGTNTQIIGYEGTNIRDLFIGADTVGIDTSVTTEKLNVEGNIRLEGDHVIDVNSSAGTFQFEAGDTEPLFKIDMDTDNLISFGSGGGDSFEFTRYSTFPGSLQVPDDALIRLGSSGDNRMAHTSTGNDNLQLAIRGYGYMYSGYLSLMELSDLGHANRSPSSYTNHPTLRIYADGVVSETDHIQFYHDATEGHIQTGDGDVVIAPASGIVSIDGTDDQVCGQENGDCIDFDDGGDGMIDLKGVGGTNNEALRFDLESTANIVEISSPTSADIRITDDSLYVMENIAVGTYSPSASFRGAGDIYVTSGIKAMEGLYSEAVAYGAGLEIQNNSLVVTYTNIAFGDATLTAATQLVTDAHASFDSTYEGQYFKVIGSTPDFTGATGEIISVPSSTTLVVSFATAGADSIVDATAMSFVIYPEPLFFVGDNGDIHSHVGVHEDSSFKVCTEDSNNEHAVHFESTSGTDSNRGLDIDHDADGYNVGVGMAVNYVSGALENGDVGGGIFVTMDDTEIVAASTDTIIGAIAVSTTTQSGAKKRGLVVLPGFTEALVVQGATAENPDYGYEVTSGSEADRVNGTPQDGTAFLASSTSDLTIFDNDNDYILIGSDAMFEDVEVNLVSGGTVSITPTFWYSKAGGNWTTLPIQGDGSNGFQSGGNIIFDAPSGWTKDDEDMDANAITDAYYVAIVRTRNNLTNKPVESHFHTFASQDTGAVITGVGAMKPIGKAADPCADTTQFPVGSMFYNSTDNYPCFCNESNVARKMTDSANCY